MKIIESMIVGALNAYTRLLDETPWPVAYIVATTVSLTAMFCIAAAWTLLEK